MKATGGRIGDPRRLTAILNKARRQQRPMSADSARVQCTQARTGLRPAGGRARDMGEAVYQDVQSSMELLASKQMNEAIEKLTRSRTRARLREGGRQLQPGLRVQLEDDHASATKAFAKALSFNALPRSQHEQLQFNLGQLYIVIGQHENGIKTLQDYIANACGNVPAEAHIFLGQRADRNASATRKRCRRSIWRCRRRRSRRSSGSR